MKTLEKRDYSHLHLIDEKIINEVYRKIHSELEENNPVVGYNTSGESIKKKQLLADLLDAEKQIEKGGYMTLDELDEDSKTW